MEIKIKSEEPQQGPNEQPQPASEPITSSGIEEPSTTSPGIEEASTAKAEPILLDDDKTLIHHRFWHWYLTHKKWAIPASLIVVVLVVSLIPLTRYKTAGLVLKKDAAVIIKDSVTNSPVSGANISIDTHRYETDANGRVVLRSLRVGHHSLVINKKYYQERKLDL